MNSLTWQELLTLIEEAPGFARRAMRQPCTAAPPADTLLAKIEKAACHAGLSVLFRRHLLSCLAAGRKLNSDFLEGYCLSTHLAVNQAHLLNTKWKTFPVVTCKGGLCSVTWILAGVLPHSPSDSENPVVCEGDFAQESITALRRSLAAACSYKGNNKRGPVIFIPIINSPEETISGCSLGLPAALALLLDADITRQNSLLATGGIDSSGKILPVDMFAAKEEFVAGTGAALICPLENFLHAQIKGYIIPCNSLDEAVDAARLFLANEVSDISFPLLIASSKDPELFIKHFSDIPLTLLRTGRFQVVMHEVAENPGRFIAALAGCLNAVSSKPEYAGLISTLFTPEQMIEIAGNEPSKAVHAFRAVTAIIAIMGHSGETAAVSPWMDAAHEIEAMAGATAIASYYNQCVAVLRHNRFDFRPELPEEFVNGLSMEQQVANIKNEDNWLLGAMHGTVAQNYGFCGPNFLEEVRKHVQLGIRAFGVRYADESARLRNYLVYALLDAKELKQAEYELIRNVLRNNTGEKNLHDLLEAVLKATEQKSSKTDNNIPFFLALALRLLADSGENMRHNAFPQISFLVSKYRYHPWQLIAFNSARLAINNGYVDDAGKLLAQALEICMEGSTTMKVMALLPFSLMHVLGMDSHGNAATANKIMDIISDKRLVETEHFKELAQAGSVKDVLQQVAEKPEKWFPFSYR